MMVRPQPILACGLSLGLSLGLIACSSVPAPPPAEALEPPPPPVAFAASNWQSVATPADRERLRGWRDMWLRALAAARAAGHGAEIAAEGALLLPDAALPDPVPPVGDYRCRTTKLGARARGQLDYVAYPAFRCRISREGGALRLVKLTGSQRPAGTLLPDGRSRLVFLGTMVLGDERRAQRYGQDADRDIIGAFERIGPDRWRLVMPSPRWESLTDVMELLPA